MGCSSFLQNVNEKYKYHTGIFIDIFPIDRIPNGRLKRYLFFWDCMRYQLFTREFVPIQNGCVKRIVSRIILTITPKGKRAQKREKLLSKITENNHNHEFATVAIETFDTMHKPLAKNMLDGYTTIQFEDMEFMCFAAWDEYLHAHYGDYMQLPPEEERVWKHHPIIIDFEHNYEELSQSRG